MANVVSSGGNLTLGHFPLRLRCEPSGLACRVHSWCSLWCKSLGKWHDCGRKHNLEANSQDESRRVGCVPSEGRQIGNKEGGEEVTNTISFVALRALMKDVETTLPRGPRPGAPGGRDRGGSLWRRFRSALRAWPTPSPARAATSPRPLGRSDSSGPPSGG